jgi:transcriptional regulator with XRE-family HTH domain
MGLARGGESGHIFPIGNIGRPDMASRRQADRSTTGPARTTRTSERHARGASRGEASGFAESAAAAEQQRRPTSGTGATSTRSADTDAAARAQAQQFGALVRERREALRMRQDDLALATGVGRRFILELEGGKPSCQLGRALIVAAAVGLRPFDLMSANSDDDNALLPDLDDRAEDEAIENEHDEDEEEDETDDGGDGRRG